MPSDLSISPLPVQPPIGRAEPATRQSGPAGTQAAGGIASHAPNPSLRLDSTLGMVVIEFRDDAGAVTRSIPTERQLNAYRTHASPAPAATDLLTRGEPATPASTTGTPDPKSPREF